jgi:predicted small lipoprotein YifL
MSSNRRVVGMLVAAALVALAGCGTAGVDTPTFAPTTTDPVAPTTTADDDTYALGERVELAHENATVEVRVVEYEFADAFERATDDGGTETVESPAGQQFLFVKVTVEHVDGSATATPAAGVRPSNDSVDVSDSLPASYEDGLYRSVRELPVGATSTGWIAVQVDADVTASDVRVGFSPDILLTEDEYRWTLVDEDD